MRRNGGGHTDSDTGRLIAKKVRETGRKNDRFLTVCIIGIDERNGVLIDISCHLQCDFG